MTVRIFPIVLGTTNLKKKAEMARILAAADIPTAPWPEDLTFPEVVEDGATFAANAAKKARAFSAALSGRAWVLADDSGLEVDFLSGRPGVLSHRYAGEPPDDGRNNQKLLVEMQGVPRARRTARFRCALALARGPEEFFSIEGVCEGVIAEFPRGDRDFGYDPVFFYPPAGKTFAEMSPEEKNAVSHRGAALRALARHLGEQELLGRTLPPVFYRKALKGFWVWAKKIRRKLRAS